MRNVSDRELLIARDIEIIFIIIIFSFLFWAVFPGKKIISNAVNENKNLDLTQLYLKNIAKKYPSNFEVHFALSDIYLKQGDLIKAKESLYPLSNIKDEVLSQKRDLYYARITLFSINEKSDKKDFIFLREYYSSKKFFSSPDKEKYVWEYVLKLISLSLWQESADFAVLALKTADNFEDKKLCLKIFLYSTRAGNLFKKNIRLLDSFAHIFYIDDESANDIIKTYLQAQEPYKAAEYAEKILKLRKIL
ncbi:MAG: hypothetical protein GX447_03460 [Elusimicrobia bacterium]|nr:hypothetical protein [Elusimicrobiota bacterium]